jgi:F0F1-type ATP synthase assembly protein I
MDWAFYFMIFGVLIGFFAVILSVRYFLNRRLAKIEKEHQMEEEARQIARSNSGL